MQPKKIAFIFGTRPEAIKLAPLIRTFQQYPTLFTTSVIVTAQQREMLDQVINLFRIKPDHDLNIMTSDQTLGLVTSRVAAGLEGILAKESPDLVIVQGDTTTTFVGALAAFYHKVPVAHVEAGLRTDDRLRPFPEEMNRRLTSVLADLHFVATERARENLLREGISPKVVWVTGNTVIDALGWVLEQPYQFPPDLARLFQGSQARRILVTAHRRDSHGVPLRGICDAILEVIHAMPDVEVIFPVHPSPRVRQEVTPLLQGNERIHLIPPLDYQAFVNVMQNVCLILTDSGGIQEEAPSLGVPVLLLREETERPEAVRAGAVKMVGTDPKVITSEVQRLLLDDHAYKAMTRRSNLYGTGHASFKIAEHIARHFNVSLPVRALSFDNHALRHR